MHGLSNSSINTLPKPARPYRKVHLAYCHGGFIVVFAGEYKRIHNAREQRGDAFELDGVCGLRVFSA